MVAISLLFCTPSKGSKKKVCSLEVCIICSTVNLVIRQIKPDIRPDTRYKKRPNYPVKPTFNLAFRVKCCKLVDGDVETTDTELNYNTDSENLDAKSDVGATSDVGSGIETLFEGKIAFKEPLLSNTLDMNINDQDTKTRPRNYRLIHCIKR